MYPSRVKSVVAWFVVSAALVAINVFCAGVIFAFLKALQILAPGLAEEPWATYPVGIAGLALSLWLVFKAYRISEKLLQGRGRARA